MMLSAMPKDLDRVLSFVMPIVAGGLGVAVVLWFQVQARERRLRKYLAKLGEIAVSAIPAKITFEELVSHSWSNNSQYAESKAAFESLGFQRIGQFIAAPGKSVVEFWIGREPGLFATIGDSSES